ncbi:inositol monophosphatase family protein [Roseovarius rhodophyticola]|uniref:Inositol monophosphatase n=1 Tax=Roseovarius rhodophyticola TaxID=3080827 RepID=A0ABZ2TH67_9RHOB|nr:inositol monophosphatase [Roseovarius sp. W115]MDV2930818.1 inositol monophosphatase [Roseovarius sp. W115]
MADSLPIPLTSPLSPAQKTSLINLVRRAAKAEILPRFRNLGQGDIRSKSNAHDLVTEADTAAEAMMARGIQAMFPLALVVGEEAAATNPELKGKIGEAELAFIIDPVDGTWNFANGLGVFGVILSITRFGKPVFGLLYDPLADDWISADEDGPAELTRAIGTTRPLTVSDGGDLGELAGFTHYNYLPQEAKPGVAKALPKLGRAMSLQCACHEYRTLARGGADFLFSGTLNPWDHAAGILICQRAGGVARMLNGDDYTATVSDGYILVASNEATWEKLRDHFAFLLDDAKA